MNKIYKSASVVMAGFACTLIVLQLIASISTRWITAEDYFSLWYWLSPLFSLATPILCGWVGILIRGAHPASRTWVKILLLLVIPASYLMWMLLHRAGIGFSSEGVRCMWLYAGILGYLIPVERLDGKAKDAGWIEMLLFLASYFCYVGISRVVDHFGVDEFQMLEGEWVRLFCRAIRFVPLAMSVFFLSEFSFTRAGQSLGEKRAVGRVVMAMSGISFIIVVTWCLTNSIHAADWMKPYRLLTQPVAVYLLAVCIRAFGKLRRPKRDGWADIFPSGHSCPEE